MNIFKIYTSQEYSHPPLCNMDVSSRFTHHMTKGTNSVPSWPLEEMHCHTHGGVETYHSPSFNVSSDYSIHQMFYYIHTYPTLLQILWSRDVFSCELTWSVLPTTLLWKSPSV